MTPTNKLRFVEREVQVPASKFDSNITKGVKIRKLQQWWEAASGGTINLGFGGEIPVGEVTGEWRDVPLEEEQ